MYPKIYARFAFAAIYDGKKEKQFDSWQEYETREQRIFTVEQYFTNNDHLTATSRKFRTKYDHLTGFLDHQSYLPHTSQLPKNKCIHNVALFSGAFAWSNNGCYWWTILTRTLSDFNPIITHAIYPVSAWGIPWSCTLSFRWSNLSP